MSNNDLSYEYLYERYLQLERNRKEETKLRQESEILMQGLNILTTSPNTEKMFSGLLEVLHTAIGCEYTAILMPNVSENLSPIACNMAEMLGTQWKPLQLFSRVLQGNTSAVFNIKPLPEWQQQSAELQKLVTSALHVPLTIGSRRGMLICTHQKTAFFNQSHIQLVQRFAPLAAQAILSAEAREVAHQQELESHRLTMQTILDHAPIGIWMIDRQQKVKFINRFFCEMLGVTEQQCLQAETYTACLPACLSPQHAPCPIKKTSSSSMESLLCADGQTHHFEIIHVPVKRADRQLQGYMGLAIDATQRIHAEKAKTQMQAQVEHTQRLESLGILAGGIAHDFNNILTAILGSASLAMSMLEQDSPLNDIISPIESASQQAAALCKQMLDYSGKGKFEIRATNLSTLIQEMQYLLAVSVGKHVQVEYELYDSLVEILIDQSQVQQILMNLVMNASEAIEAIKRGKICVQTGYMYADTKYLSQTYFYGKTLTSGKYIYLEVRDNGSGMSKDVCKNIFDPFFTTKFTGRGLGMSAVLGIVRGHQGALHLESVVGQGSCFRILFPITEPNDA